MFMGIFPAELKKGIVSVIFKNSDKTNPSNYRPITISPVIGKIFEYSILRRLEDHISANNILSTQQFFMTFMKILIRKMQSLLPASTFPKHLTVYVMKY